MSYVDREAHITETAQRIGEQQRRDRNKLIFYSSALTLLIVIVTGFIGLLYLQSILSQIEAQNEDLDRAFFEARLDAARETAQLERILAGIENRQVPRSEVEELQREVRFLQTDVEQLGRQTRRLTQAINELTAQLSAVRRTTQEARRRAAAGSGGVPVADPPVIGSDPPTAPPPSPPPAKKKRGKSCDKPPNPKAEPPHCVLVL